jgi:hypothetical protein
MDRCFLAMDADFDVRVFASPAALAERLTAAVAQRGRALL